MLIICPNYVNLKSKKHFSHLKKALLYYIDLTITDDFYGLMSRRLNWEGYVTAGNKKIQTLKFSTRIKYL